MATSTETVRAVARAVLACTGNVYAYRRLDNGRYMDVRTRRAYESVGAWADDLDAGADRDAVREV